MEAEENVKNAKKEQTGSSSELIGRSPLVLTRRLRIDTSVFSLFFVWVEALRQQLFSHGGMEPPLPGYNQYFLGVKSILLNDTTRRPE